MQSQHPRLKTYHSSKQRILGNQASPAPAWRPNAQTASGSNSDVGSKIFLSRLPVDVVDNEVETLFTRTVGPVKDAFMVYNTQGKSRGMAIVSFVRAGDAAVARAKYNGKIVDGRRPIKIEIIVDQDDPRKSVPAPPAQVSLLARITSATTPTQAVPTPTPNGQRGVQPHTNTKAQPATLQVHAPTTRLVRTKKGPRRLKPKRQQTQQSKQKPTAEELDREMDDYRAQGKTAFKTPSSY